MFKTVGSEIDVRLMNATYATMVLAMNCLSWLMTCRIKMPLCFFILIFLILRLIFRPKCNHPLCVPAKMVIVEPQLPLKLDLNEISETHPAFEPAVRVFPVYNDVIGNKSVILFEKDEEGMLFLIDRNLLYSYFSDIYTISMSDFPMHLLS